MIRILLFLFLATFSFSDAYAASKPSGLNFPEVPDRAPQSDCEQSLKNWDFPTDYIVSQNKEYLFLIIDRYGGKRDFPDYRGAMCRVKDMKEMWSVYEMFPATDIVAISDNGKYLVDGMGFVSCKTVEDILKFEKTDAITFHVNGEPIKKYYLDDILPSWRSYCEGRGIIFWLDDRDDFKNSISADNTTFTLKTGDGEIHYFDLKTGNKTTAPKEDEEKPSRSFF